MPGIEDLPFNKSGPSEKVGEQTNEGGTGDLDQSGDKVGEAARESASESWGGFSSAGQFIQAMKKEEGKQREKEDEIVKILRNYLHSNKYPEILEQVVKLLGLNVYAGFLLTALILVDKELEETVIERALPSGDTETVENDISERNLPTFSKFDGKNIPPQVKERIEAWMFSLTEVASGRPQRFLEEISDDNKQADYEFQVLLRLIVNQFFADHAIEGSLEEIQAFAEFIFDSITDKLVKQLEGQKEIT